MEKFIETMMSLRWDEVESLIQILLDKGREDVAVELFLLHKNSNINYGVAKNIIEILVKDERLLEGIDIINIYGGTRTFIVDDGKEQIKYPCSCREKAAEEYKNSGSWAQNTVIGICERHQIKGSIIDNDWVEYILEGDVIRKI